MLICNAHTTFLTQSHDKGRTRESRLMHTLACKMDLQCGLPLLPLALHSSTVQQRRLAGKATLLLC